MTNNKLIHDFWVICGYPLLVGVCAWYCCIVLCHCGSYIIWWRNCQWDMFRWCSDIDMVFNEMFLPFFIIIENVVNVIWVSISPFITVLHLEDLILFIMRIRAANSPKLVILFYIIQISCFRTIFIGDGMLLFNVKTLQMLISSSHCITAISQ